MRETILMSWDILPYNTGNMGEDEKQFTDISSDFLLNSESTIRFD